MSDQAYIPQPYPSGQPGGIQALQATIEGQRAANQSTAFGIIGLFILPFVFGPIALAKASTARRLGVSSTTGLVLGWIDIALVVIGAVLLLLVLLGGIAAYSS